MKKTQSHNPIVKNNILPPYLKYALPCILVLTIIVFFNSLSNDFVLNWDDETYLMKNPYIQHLSWDSIKTIFTEFYASNYHPFTTISFGIDYSLFGNNAKPYHVVNLILHLLNTSLVFYLIKKIICRIDASALVAVLFAIHPMHVESVAWISERKDLLYSLFYLGSLLCYVQYLKSNNFKYLIFTFLLFLFSCFSKSAAVTLPVILFLLDYLLIRKHSLKTVFEKIPFFLIAVLFGVLAIFSQKEGGALQNLSSEFGYFSRFFLISWSVAVYLFKMFFPIHLSTFYYYPESSHTMGLDFYLAPLIFIAFIVFIVKFKMFRRELIFGFLFFLVGLSPTLHFIPVGGSIVSERYTYIPYLGLFFIAAQIYIQITDGKIALLSKYKKIIPLGLVLLIICFSIISINRNFVWKNAIILFTDVIEKNPGGDFGYQYRGVAKALAGDNKGCIDDQNKAIEIKPTYAEAYYSRGLAKMNSNDYKGGFFDFQKAVSFKKDYPDAYNNMGNIMIKYKQFDKALAFFDQVLLYKPQFNVALYNKGVCFYYKNDFANACNFWNQAEVFGHSKASEMKRNYCK